MSARDPHYCSPARARIIKGYPPEDVIHDCAMLGLSVKLYEPDLGKSPEFEIWATGDEMRGLRKHEPWRYYGPGKERYLEDAAWKARNSELCTLAAKAQTVEAFALLAQHQGREWPPLPSNYQFAPRPREGWGDKEYARRDDAKETCRKFRCYRWNEIVIATASERGLRCERVSIPARDFVIMWVWGAKRDFRAAQYEWLRRMIAAMPKVVTGDKRTPVEELSLFV